MRSSQKRSFHSIQRVRQGWNAFIRIVFMLALLTMPHVAMAQPAPCPNDDCNTAAPISGEGVWNLDNLMTSTMSTVPAPLPGTNFDVWFCWTPTWTGVAQLDIGATSVHAAEVYVGCACPQSTSVPVLAMIAWQGQSAGTFDVVCGQRYLVRIGAEAYPHPMPIQDAVRSFNLSKVSGDDCPLPAPGDCVGCCDSKPNYDDPLWTANYTGQVALVSQSAVSVFGPVGNNPNVLEWINFAQSPAPGGGGLWDPVAPTGSATTFRYFKPNWNFNTLGSIFAVTIDSSGNAYTAYCAATNGPKASSIAGSTGGSIFKIDAVTGAPTVFCNIPDNTTPPPILPGCYLGTYGGSVADCMAQSSCPPGIGDVSIDCANNDQLFASCLADGRIYRITAAGVPVEAFDHAGNAIQPPTAVVGNDYSRYTARGRRIWAVQPHQGRLYYSVWGQEGPCDGISLMPGSMANSIWSVGLSGTGAFVPNSRRMELLIPAFPPITIQNQFFKFQYSYPVSDISFSNSCHMMLAERNISEVGVLVGAHASRALEYAWNGTAWVSTFPRMFGAPQQSPLGHPVGFNIFPTLPPSTNSCGGTDYDESIGALPLGRVWLTSDQLNTSGGNFGIEGIDQAAPNLSTSIGIRFSNLASKAQMCDVEIPCAGAVGPDPCFNISEGKIFCPIGPGASPGCYTYTFNITNKSGLPIKYVTIPLHPTPTSPITINPNIINLLTQDGSLLEDGETTTITLTICNGNPGDDVSLKIGLVTAAFVECCFEKILITLPECDCGQLAQQHISKVICDPLTGLVSFSYSFTIQNLSNFPADWVIFIPFKDETATFVKDFHFLPPLQPGGSFPLTVQITGATPGETFCFNALMQHPDRAFLDCCCAFEKCITVPECPGTPNSTCIGDVNHDGQVNVNDMLNVINTWGPTPKPCNANFATDTNHDCMVDVNDLLTVINNWGPCRR